MIILKELWLSLHLFESLKVSPLKAIYLFLLLISNDPFIPKALMKLNKKSLSNFIVQILIIKQHNLKVLLNCRIPRPVQSMVCYITATMTHFQLGWGGGGGLFHVGYILGRL